MAFMDSKLPGSRRRFHFGAFLSAALSILLASFVVSCSGSSSRDDSGLSGDFREACLRGEITVYGEAPIYTSTASALDKAKEDACRKAVEKCIGEEIAQSSGTGDGQSLGFEIFTKARGICRNDSLIEQETYNLDTIKMLRAFFRFEVSASDINNQINLMQKLAGNPRILVLIREEYNLAGQPRRVESFNSRNAQAASALRDALVQKGYNIVDVSRINTAGLNEALISSNPNDVPARLLDEAAKAEADVLVIGNIEANAQNIATLGQHFKSYKATGNVAIVTLWGRGEVLGEFSKVENGAQTTDLAAARAAMERFAVGAEPNRRLSGLAQFVHSRLQSRWGSITRNNIILMKIQGLSFDEAGIFRDDLQIKTAVKGINEIRSSQNETVWEVTYPGRVFALRDTMAYYAQNPKIFQIVAKKKLIVTEAKRGEISIRFQ
ncbi:MAG: hypothetical protein CMN76_05015 [Spirochaetaceae bacterium]|nr:hypothetical protein [Spirochaetaceae bacterium]|tara:strand:- start:23648 stop:24958 length:1311 start_codon:yes stop_codon:yes gene_type:complete